jgi:hypothetical protein
MAIPQAPDNMNDFMSQAQAFVKRAKDQGASNTAIANTLTFMYNLTQNNIASKQKMTMTPYEQSQLDLAKQGQQLQQQQEAFKEKGTWQLDPNTNMLVNSVTGETKAGPHMGNASDYFAPSTSPQAPRSSAPHNKNKNLDDFFGAKTYATPASPTVQTPSPVASYQPGTTNGQVAQNDPNSWQGKANNSFSNTVGAFAPKL